MCSFKDKFDQSTEINFEKGSMLINETWVPQYKNDNAYSESRETATQWLLKIKQNICSYQIDNISSQL